MPEGKYSKRISSINNVPLYKREGKGGVFIHCVFQRQKNPTNKVHFMSRAKYLSHHLCPTTLLVHYTV